MAAPRQTIWKLEPHTRAKHEILRRYLQAWMVILSQGKFPEILYIDGFSGPGEYVDGEVGSPVIALETALSYNPPLRARVHFLFVDKDERRAEHLRTLVGQMSLPSNFRVLIEGGVAFEDAFQQACARICAERSNDADLRFYRSIWVEGCAVQFDFQDLGSA